MTRLAGWDSRVSSSRPATRASCANSAGCWRRSASRSSRRPSSASPKPTSRTSRSSRTRSPRRATRARSRGCPRSPTIRASASTRSTARPACSRRATRASPRSDARNNAKLIAALAGVADRRAHYYCVLVLVRHADDPGADHRRRPLARHDRRRAARRRRLRLRPALSRTRRRGLTGAELPLERKNELSHRGKAMRALIARLEEETVTDVIAARIDVVGAVAARASPRCRRSRSTCTFRGACASARTATSIRTRRRGEVPEAAYVDALIADLEFALPSIWGRRVAFDLHRRRHAEPLFGGGDRSAARRRFARACRSRPTPRSRSKPIRERSSAQKFAGFRAAGVNRLSLGVQSFDPRSSRRSAACTTPTRRARAADAALAIFGNVNLDLMYALPRQTVDAGARPTSPRRSRSRRRTCRSIS